MTTMTRSGLVAVMAAALAAGPALADKGGVPNGGDGTDNPHAAQPATPAQPGVAPAQPAQPAEKPAEPAKTKEPKPAKAAEPSQKPKEPKKPKKAKAPKPAPAPAAAAPEPASPPAAKAGKVTICHATGSETNPYVEITISRNGLNGHARHHDGADIIPAPEGGCPAPAPAAAAAPAPPADQQQAPAAAAEPAPAEPAVAGSSAQQPSGIRVLGVSDTRAAASSAQPSAQVAGASDTLEVARASDDETGTVAGLPFTGLELGMIVALGLAALLAGTALRRTLANRTTV